MNKIIFLGFLVVLIPFVFIGFIFPYLFSYPHNIPVIIGVVLIPIFIILYRYIVLKFYYSLKNLKNENEKN